MKGIKLLIRLEKKKIDELKKRQNTLLQRKESLEFNKKNLEENLRKEISIASEMPDLRGFFGNYSQHIKKQCLDLDKEIEGVNTRVNNITDEIYYNFGEMKKYEIAEKNAKIKAKKTKNKKEQQTYDEVAIRKYFYN